MKITDVKVSPVSGDKKLKALAAIVIDDCILIKDIKVISDKTGLFIVMPTKSDMPVKKTKDGSHRGLDHLIGKPAMQMIEDRILVEYNKA